MKVSFDFDSTLTETRMQELAKKFIDKGVYVRITTSRPESYTGHYINNFIPNNKDVYALANKLGIQDIKFTNYEDKVNYLKDFDIHFDDDDEEIFLINEHPCKCLGVLYNG